MARIKVGSNCFIGHGVSVLGGVTIGDNVIIGTMSVVTKNIPSGSVAAGMPARVICTLEEYYKKNLSRGVFYPTPTMSAEEKKNYLINHVPQLQ